MEIEIVEFYEESRNEEKRHLKGTLHIYLIDLQLDLRGIRVFKENKKWWLNLPRGFGNDEVTKQRVFFPYFAFMDREKNKQLLKEIRTKGIPFIKQKVGQPFFKPD